MTHVEADPTVDRTLHLVAAAGDNSTAEQLLAALAAVRELRSRLDDWEPRLIAAARAAGASWAQLAPALGVASRQAAERRFLRLHRSETGGADGTRDERVQAVRDRRAGDRAVAGWARQHSAALRQLAGQITALTDLDTAARAGLDELHDALGGDDAATLVPLLAATHAHLPARHAQLANRVAAVTRDADEVRRDTQNRRSAVARRDARLPMRGPALAGTEPGEPDDEPGHE
jgi:hypothetical protein